MTTSAGISTLENLVTTEAIVYYTCAAGDEGVTIELGVVGAHSVVDDNRRKCSIRRCTTNQKSGWRTPTIS